MHIIPEFYSLTYERCDDNDHPLHFLAHMPLGGGDDLVVSVAGNVVGTQLEVDEDLTADLIARAMVRSEMVQLAAQEQQEDSVELDSQYDWGGYL